MLDFGPCFGYDSSCLLLGMAQFGRALRSGRRGRGFESRRLDYLAGATPEVFTDLRGSFFARSNEPCVDDHKKARWELAHIRAFLWLATYGECRDSHELPRSEVTCRQGSLHYKVSHAWTGWQADAGSLLTGRRMADWTHTANAATVTSCSAAK